MTKENREKLYSHYKDLAENYEARPHLNKGLTSTQKVRGNAKEHVIAMLKQHPELDVAKQKAKEAAEKKVKIAAEKKAKEAAEEEREKGD